MFRTKRKRAETEPMPATVPELAALADELADSASDLIGALGPANPAAMAQVAASLAVVAELRALRLTIDPLTRPRGHYDPGLGPFTDAARRLAAEGAA